VGDGGGGVGPLFGGNGGDEGGGSVGGNAKQPVVGPLVYRVEADCVTQLVMQRQMWVSSSGSYGWLTPRS